jgi:hypothetical protein
MEPIRRIPQLVRALYEVVGELEDLFPDRRFTPDGHLVGSIGEVLAAYYYSLYLLPASTEGHDALSEDGRRVQIKATQVKSIGLRSKPDHLLVIRILPNGEFEEVYNGPGDFPWEKAGKMQSNGQRQISLSKLSVLMSKVSHSSIPRRVAS